MGQWYGQGKQKQLTLHWDLPFEIISSSCLIVEPARFNTSKTERSFEWEEPAIAVISSSVVLKYYELCTVLSENKLVYIFHLSIFIAMLKMLTFQFFICMPVIIYTQILKFL